MQIQSVWKKLLLDLSLTCPQLVIAWNLKCWKPPETLQWAQLSVPRSSGVEFSSLKGSPDYSKVVMQSDSHEIIFDVMESFFPLQLTGQLVRAW